MPWHFFKAMQCCLEKGPNVVVLLGMGEREGVNGSFHRQENYCGWAISIWKNLT